MRATLTRDESRNEISRAFLGSHGCVESTPTGLGRTETGGEVELRVNEVKNKFPFSCQICDNHAGGKSERRN
jgi:hypothetical protein